MMNVRRCLPALLAVLGTTACGSEFPADRGEVPEERTVIASADASATSSSIIFGTACTEPEAFTSGALLFEGRANFGGGLEDFHTVLCSVVLVRPDVALTAAHCIDLAAQGALFVAEANFSVSFASDLRSVYDTGAAFPPDATTVLETEIHPNFDAARFVDAEGLSGESDIAVLFLAAPRFDVPLASVARVGDIEVDVGTQLLLVGYGTTSVDGAVIGENATGRRRCVNSFVNQSNAAEFQAGSGPVSGRRCEGDSGGPTFLRSSPRTLVGLGSRAIDEATACAEGGVDTRLDALGPYLDTVVRAACADGGPRVDCDFPGLFVEDFDAGGFDAGGFDAGDIDAGERDAGERDAGERDAGERDAGDIDAGVFDAGDIDAGVFDAGDIDAGERDAGERDAGDIDAGVFDAGDIDAGVFDAGVFDAGDFDAGDLDAGGFDAGERDAGALDAGDGAVPPGCGCSTSNTPAPTAFALVVFGIFAFCRRRRR